MSKLPDPRLVRELLMSDPAVKKPMFVLQLANAEDVESAAIQVDKIQGPGLLLSGDDDRLWPSRYMAEMVMHRLSQHAHPYPSRHFSYRGCGHVFPLPTMVPPPTRRAHRFTGELVDYGGTLEATAWAAWDSWSKVLQFLATHLKG